MNIDLNFLTEEAKKEFIEIFGKNEFFLHNFVSYKSKGITVQPHEIAIIQKAKKLFRDNRINIYTIEIETLENWEGYLLVWINGEEVDPEFYEDSCSGDYIVNKIMKAIANENVKVGDTRCGSFSMSFYIKRDPSLF